VYPSTNKKPSKCTFKSNTCVCFIDRKLWLWSYSGLLTAQLVTIRSAHTVLDAHTC